MIPFICVHVGSNNRLGEVFQPCELTDMQQQQQYMAAMTPEIKQASTCCTSELWWVSWEGGGSILNLNPVANEECTERQLRITPPPLTRFPPEPLKRINKCKVR